MLVIPCSGFFRIGVCRRSSRPVWSIWSIEAQQKEVSSKTKVWQLPGTPIRSAPQHDGLAERQRSMSLPSGLGRRTMPAAIVKSIRWVLIGWALSLMLTSAFQAAAKIGPPITKLRDAVPITLDNAEAHYALGVALESQGEFDAAIVEYREAIRLNPTLAAAHVNLGVVLVDQGKVNAAVAEFREAIRLNPNDSEAHSNLGFALASQGKLDAAVAECREAIRLAPSFAAAHVNLGMALGRQGRVDVAITEFRQAIRLAPNLAQAHSNLGAALFSQGKLTEAIAEIREATRLAPNLAIAHSNLGHVLRLQGRIDRAVAEFREAIRLHPNLAAARVGLGVVLADRGDAFLWNGEYYKALKAYQEVLRLKPDAANVHVRIGYIHFLTNRFEKAVEDFKGYLGLLDSPYGDENAYIMIWQHLSLKSSGKHDEAQELLEDFAMGSKSEGWGSSLFRYHQGKLSESDLVSWAKEKGEQCQAYFYIGYQYLLSGDMQKASEYFQKTVDTKSFDCLEHLGARAKLEQFGVN